MVVSFAVVNFVCEVGGFYFRAREFASGCRQGLQLASKSAILQPPATQNATDTHTHTHTHGYLYCCRCVFVVVFECCACVFVVVSVGSMCCGCGCVFVNVARAVFVAV